MHINISAIFSLDPWLLQNQNNLNFRKRLEEERRKREEKDKLDREQAIHAFTF